MKKTITTLALCMALMFLTGTAAADTVNFSTLGTLACNGAASCVSGGSSVTIGAGLNTVTITFTGLSNSVNAPTNTSFGVFNVSVSGTGAGISGGPILFSLFITQTIPTAGGGTLSGVVTGSVFVSNQTNGQVSFTVTGGTTTIGYVVYNVFNLNNLLVPPSTNSGDTTLQGQVAVPEPASMFLLGSGLLGAGSYVRRKFGV